MSIPPVRFKDYTEVNTSSSEETDQISRSQPLSSMSESISSLRSALHVLSDDTSMIDQTQNSTQLGLRSFEKSSEGSLLADVERQDQQAAGHAEEQCRRAELARQAVEQAEQQLRRAELAKQAVLQAGEQLQLAKFSKQTAQLEEEQHQRTELTIQAKEQLKRSELSIQTVTHSEEQLQRTELAIQAVRQAGEQLQRSELPIQGVTQEEEQLQRTELAIQAVTQAGEQLQRTELAKQDELRRQQRDMQQQPTRGKGSEIDGVGVQLALLDGEASRQNNSLQAEEELRQQQTEFMRLESEVQSAKRNNIGVRNVEAFLYPGYGSDVVTKQQAHFIQPTINNELLTQLLRSIRDAQRDHHQYCVNQFRNMNSRIDRVVGLLEHDLEFQTKPEALPMTTPQGIEDFETASDEEFRQMVLYLSELGGFNLNETANFTIKYAIEDSLSPSLTWQGREPGTLKLQETKLAKAFYAAV